ncbi:MAG: ribonuclease Y [bacterium]|nr:ribonuclease Y [bacterium]
MNFNPFLTGGLVLFGLAIGYFIRLFIAKQQYQSLEAKSKDFFNQAEAKAKEIIVEAKDKAASIINTAVQEEKDRKGELRRFEDRLLKKEDGLEQDRKQFEGVLERQRKAVEDLDGQREELKKLEEKTVKDLEVIAGLSRDEATKKIFEEIKNRHREELAVMLAGLERDKRDQIEAKSLEIITSVIQRYSRSHVTDITTTAVNLPNDEIKGKIIGREGRNIRAFERLTGVEVIVDETPEVIILSSFDPWRREIAKIALENLIRDGRIQPAKIEEQVESAKDQLEARVEKIGEEAAYDVGIVDLPKEIVRLLGRLNFRTSYGQNVLAHSVEMAHISGMLAAELGLRINIAKKAALVHDIGKAIDQEVEGTHVELGRKILKKYGVEEDVIRAMESHHDDYPYSVPEAHVVTAADVISAARPGARRETLEKYIKRLEDLERVVNSFEGVKQSYAISAGREVRVFVTPEKIDDFGALNLAKDIAAKIKSDMQYPGEIKVTVIREVKAVEYAR